MKKIIIVMAITAALAAAAQAKTADRILVKVNDDIVMQSEVDEALDFTVQQMQAMGKPVDKAAIRKQLLERLIEQKLVMTMASEEMVQISEEAVADKVNEYLNRLRSGYKTEEDFEAALLKEGISYSDFRLRIEEQVRNSLVFGKIKQKKQQEFIVKSAVSDVELQKYYDANKNDFKVDDEISLAQIYFPSEGGKDVAAAAKKAADRLAAGEDFDKVLADAKTSGGDGGDLGAVDTTQMNKTIRDALKNPKKGKVVGPINTGDGLHVLRISDYKKGQLKTFADIKEKVRVKVIESKVEIMWNEWMEKVKKQAFIKYMK